MILKWLAARFFFVGNTSIVSKPGWKRAVKDMQCASHSRKPGSMELKCLEEKLAQLGLSGNDRESAAQSFAKCLSRTSKGKSKEFIDVFVPKFLESASIFGTDSMAALSYLPDRKVMDGEDTLNQWNKDWNYIFKEFDSCARSLVSNCTIRAGEALVLTHDFKKVKYGESFFYSQVFHVFEGQITALLEVG